MKISFFNIRTIITTWFFVIVLYCLPLHASISVKYSDEKSINCNDKWHPTTFYVVYPDMSLTFNLPYERDLSGVANLFFKDKITGTIHLLDTIKNNERYHNKLLGTYDAILLYNNGKYLEYKNVVLKKDEDIKIDMENLKTQPRCSNSEYWLSLGSFTDGVENKERILKNNLDSKKTIRGYILIEDGFAADFPFVRIKRDKDKRETNCSFDGYFEIDIDEPAATLEFFCIGHNFEQLTVKENSGIFYVLDSPDPEETKNVTTGR